MAITYAARKDVPEEFTWNLADIFSTQADWTAASPNR